MVTVRIHRFLVVARLADALDDVELARALAEEDARGLPRRGEDLGRGNLEVDVQNVLVREVDAFDDVHIAIVRHADGLADRERRLRQNIDGIDDKRVTLPMADRMAMERRVGDVGMPTTVGVDAA